jgi:hypothetical protein
MHRFLMAGLILAVYSFSALPSIAADDSRPTCSSENQGRMWPEAANHDPKLISHFIRCGELLICVRGSWHYHWEAPTIRIDQLAHHGKPASSKPAVCDGESVVDAAPPHPSGSNEN